MKGKKLPAIDLAAVVSKNESELAAALAHRDKLKAAFDEEYVELHAAGNEVAIKRHRKGVSEAEASVAELTESLDRCRRALDQAKQREEYDRVAAAWRAVDLQCVAIQNAGAEIEGTMDLLATQFAAFIEQWIAVRSSLPEPPQRHQMVAPMWERGHLAHFIEMQLKAKTAGLLCASSCSLSAWELAGGPNFKRRVRESIAQLMTNRPKDIQPEPPRAA